MCEWAGGRTAIESIQCLMDRAIFLKDSAAKCDVSCVLGPAIAFVALRLNVASEPVE